MAGELIKFYHGDDVLHVDHTPGSAVAAGDVVAAGGFQFIASRDIPANALGSVASKGGVWQGISNGTNTGAGAKLYLNAGKLGATGAHIGRELPDNAAAIADDAPIMFIFDPDGSTNP